ncbi:MAG: response regulator [Deltaproteobacteria bacterium]|jgi:CheY-like chemotaxis protein
MGTATGNPTALQPVVLVVDDEPLQRRSLMRLMRPLDVREASGAFSAIELLVNGLEPDLVLCDVSMGDGTGVDLKNWLSDQRPELLERLVFMTGLGADGATAVQPYRTLMKPLTLLEIEDVVRLAHCHLE